MNDVLMIAIAGSFIGTVLALTMFWGAFQTMRYEGDGQVPVWVWVAVFLPLSIGGAAALYAMFGAS